MASTAQVLTRALDVLEDGGWTQGCYAMKVDGDMTVATDPDAIQFCADGAIYRACHELGSLDHFQDARKALTDEMGAAIVFWNDDRKRTFSEVREVFRRAAFAAGALTEETSPVAA